MASRTFHSVKHAQLGLVVVEGSFAPNGSSAVSSSSVKGKGFTVARTSAGLFTITLADKYKELISAKATLQLATAADQFVQLGSIDVTSAKTVQVRVWDVSGAAVADVAADANNRIHFSLTLRNTDVG